MPQQGALDQGFQGFCEEECAEDGGDGELEARVVNELGVACQHESERSSLHPGNSERRRVSSQKKCTKG